MYAEVLVEYPTKKIDKYFTYKVPESIQNISRGMKVLVPFGKNIINGFVINVFDDFKSDYELKEIIRVIDEEIILNEELILLGKYISNETLCPKIMAYQTMLPTSFKIKDKKHNYNSYDTYLELILSKEETKKYLYFYNKENKQTKLLDDILKNDKVLKKDYSYDAVNALKRKNLIKETKVQKYRLNRDHNLINKNKLNEEQNKVYTEICKCNKNEVFLLEGITGSGKTEVYLHLIENVLQNGKSAIMLVPEISLTMQIVNRFYDYFGSDVAILHSALSNGEKNDEYLKIIRGEVHIVIGTRSAIFAPLNNIGIIIIDEEHSDTYKQDNTPKYNAIDIAKERCKYHKVPLVLGSATPSLESRARGIKGVYKHLFLNNRVGESKLPEVHIVDMVNEIKNHNFIFSEELLNELKNTKNRSEQAIILLNRRGYSTTITCSSCGFTYKCPNCDIPLTYHKTGNKLNCHYCDYTTYKPNICPECKSKNISSLGMGTEKLEEEVIKEFNCKVVRMDVDTTSRKGSHEKIINDFKNKKYDILIGTQMISKGLDFEDVTLVGVINGDASLNIPNYRSSERTFDLLNQVSGRSGRSSKLGRVIIQGFNIDHYSIVKASINDYIGFYNEEMNIRKLLKYPPFYNLTLIKVSGKNYNDVYTEINKIHKYLINNKNIIILGPSNSNMPKLNNKYYMQIIIKYKNTLLLINDLKFINDKYKKNNKVYVDIDINPKNL